MANISLYRGGTPVVKFMWCDKDHPVYTPPFRQRHEGTISNLFADERPLAETPPYDSHADGAYNLGNFVIGIHLLHVYVDRLHSARLYRHSS